jgi:hypothetical protein
VFNFGLEVKLICLPPRLLGFFGGGEEAAEELTPKPATLKPL